MKLLAFKFKPLGRLTKIPDSQSVFGMLCYAILEKFGEEKLSQILNRFANNNPDFIVSSFFLHNLFPYPMEITMPYQPNLTPEHTIKLKELKKVRYISKDIFKAYLQDKNEFINTYSEKVFIGEYVIVQKEYLVTKEEQSQFSEQLLKKEIQIRNLVGETKEDKQLFYNELIYCRDGVYFDLYVLVLNQDIKEDIIKLISSLQYVSIGGGKSIGYNMFSCVEFEEIEFVNNNQTKTLLSIASLDQDIQYDESAYRIETLHNKINNAIHQVYKNTQTVLLEGSSIVTNKPFMGSILKEEIDDQVRYSNYLGLLV